MELERMGVATQGTLGAPAIHQTVSMGQTMVGWTIHWWKTQVSEDEVVR